MRDLSEYRSPKTLSLLAVGGLSVMALTSVLSVVLGAVQIASPDSVVDLDGESADSLWLLLQGLVYLVRFPAYIATVVVFLMWLNRANKNLSALQAPAVEFSSGWAVGWWFIPFANLVKPYQVVREVWWDSDPDFDEEPTFLSASLKTAPTFVGVWWGFWIASNIFENISSRAFDLDSIANTEIGGMLFIVSGVLSGVAAWLAVKVVRDITGRQDQRIVAVGSRSTNLPPPPPSFNGGFTSASGEHQH